MELSGTFRKAYAFDYEDRSMIDGVQAMMGSRTLDEMSSVHGASVHARRVIASKLSEEAKVPEPL